MSPMLALAECSLVIVLAAIATFNLIRLRTHHHPPTMEVL
jgi:hypothetical protein